MTIKYLKKADGKVYGPVELDRLVEWAIEGRVGPKDELSEDEEKWSAAVELKDLQKFWKDYLQPERKKDRAIPNYEEEMEHLTAENERLKQEVDRLTAILNEETDAFEDNAELKLLKKENQRLQDELHKIVAQMKKLRVQSLGNPTEENNSNDMSKPDIIQQPFMKAAANALKTQRTADQYIPPVSGLRKRTIKKSHPSLSRNIRHVRRP